MQVTAPALQETSWQSVALFAITAVSSIMAGLFSYLASRKSDIVDKKVDAVATTSDNVHALVNSDSGRVKLLLVSAFEQLAAAKPDDLSVKAQLETAKKDYADHLKNQAIVDDRAQQELKTKAAQ